MAPKPKAIEHLADRKAGLAASKSFSMGPGQADVIIVLEDDPGARAALCLLLSDWDFRPVDGECAADAIAKLGAQASAVAAIITDFDLGGGMNGVEEATALRAAGIAAPVLVVSGSLRGRAGDLARQAGFGFLAKPVLPQDIQNWLSTAG